LCRVYRFSPKVLALPTAKTLGEKTVYRDSLSIYKSIQENFMGKYLEKAASPQVINHAWRYLRNDRGVWHSAIMFRIIPA
jgi:hypothetical protein